nr:hypothetical protein [Candidatus Gracilibacteria bacterium]
MKSCILSKWYINIILFLLFGFLFMFYTSSNQDNLINCSTNLSSQDTCKSHLEKGFLDTVIPKNNTEKIDTNIVVYNGSSVYNFFVNYTKYLGFAIGFFAMLIIFILNGFKYILGLGKFKFLNVFSLFIGYFLLFLLGLNFLYWEPRFTETGVATIVFLGHTLTLISFYFCLIILVLGIVRILIYFLTKKKDEKDN